MKKYSDLLADWLVELGYTHCFFVAGGNIMHLLESCSRRFTCVPVVHEVAAGIATEYFNEVHLGGRAFALVTAGPGLTNIVTAIAGAFLESRELLVLGGQVKLADLSRGKLRQRGIQEVDGVAIVKPITGRAELIDSVLDRRTFAKLTRSDESGRRAPVFLEIPLDIQGAQVDEASLETPIPPPAPQFCEVSDEILASVTEKLSHAERPVILIGAGISRDTADALLPGLSKLGVPLMVTWNASDRVPADHPCYFGRPNTWGQRYSNVLLQQADLLLALGTRLSLQQTGFNWQQFVPVGEVVQIDCDPAELQKGHPELALSICGDANRFLHSLVDRSRPRPRIEWLNFCRKVQQDLPVIEKINHTGEGFLSPYIFVDELSRLLNNADVVIPCSSGSAFTVMMQTFAQKAGQRIVTNKALASMGYGLSGAIGAAFAAKGRRTTLVEGDGGFIQNLQELGTVSVNKLNLKIFIFDDNGYASIRMTQKNYFGGRYVGCDTATGLGVPRWDSLFAAYDIPLQELRPGFESDPAFLSALSSEGPSAFLVKVDPQQTYFPKISSRVTASGSMESNPLHLMSPDLDETLAAEVLPYIRAAR